MYGGFFRAVDGRQRQRYSLGQEFRGIREFHARVGECDDSRTNSDTFVVAGDQNFALEFSCVYEEHEMKEICGPQCRCGIETDQEGSINMREFNCKALLSWLICHDQKENALSHRACEKMEGYRSRTFLEPSMFTCASHGTITQCVQS